MLNKARLLEAVPGLVTLIAARKRLLLYRHFKGRAIQDVFEEIHGTNRWGSDESVSGTGSELAGTELLRQQLPQIIAKIGAKSLIDIPCGDFNWMKHVDLSQVDRYVGADIVSELIMANKEAYGKENRGFRVLDITSDSLPQFDLILCRDLFIHLSNADVWKALRNIKKSNSSYILLTTCRNFSKNYDIITGAAHEINLEAPPFEFKRAIQYIEENDPSGTGKSLGLWKVSDLPMK